MKNIKVLGSGCTKCKNTVALINDVAASMAVEIDMEKIEGPAQVMAYSVMSTPAVVVDEEVVHKGGIPSRDQIEEWLME